MGRREGGREGRKEGGISRIACMAFVNSINNSIITMRR